MEEVDCEPGHTCIDFSACPDFNAELSQKKKMTHSPEERAFLLFFETITLCLWNALEQSAKSNSFSSAFLRRS